MTIELCEGEVPFPAAERADLDRITLFGVWYNKPEGWEYAPDCEHPSLNFLQHHVFTYGFAFQGHCYKLSIPAEYRFEHFTLIDVCVAGAPDDACKDDGERAMPPGYAAEFRGVKVKKKVPRGPEPAVGCGYESMFVRRYYRTTKDKNGKDVTRLHEDSVPGYFMWQIDQTTPLQRIERRQGLASDLILDFNLPGRSPTTLTYSAKVAIAGRSGKAYE